MEVAPINTSKNHAE